MRFLAFMLAFAGISEGQAQAVYSFVPDPASTSDVVRLRIDVHHCFDEQIEVSVDEATRIISARFDGDDTLCDDSVPGNSGSPRFVDIGELAAGNYTAEVVGCVAFQNQCQTLHNQTLAVFGQSSTPFTVPTLSAASVFALALAALSLGLWKGRRGRGQSRSR